MNTAAANADLAALKQWKRDLRLKRLQAVKLQKKLARVIRDCEELEARIATFATTTRAYARARNAQKGDKR